jgi:hydrogenase expression/formation protein HypC
MCLSVPAQIIKVEGDMADVSVGGTIFRAGIQMIVDPMPGDYVLLHAGFAIERISEKDALETLRIIEEIKDA